MARIRKDDPTRMSAEEYRAAIDILGMSQLEAARVIGTDDRTSRRWALAEVNISPAAARLLRIMIRRNISPLTAQRLGEVPLSPEEISAAA